MSQRCRNIEGLFLGIVIWQCLLVAGVHAQSAPSKTLRFEFSIDAKINGSRPWDGTGISSASIDLNKKEGILGMPFVGTLAQVGVDEFNGRIAPPDPYICILYPESLIPGPTSYGFGARWICGSRFGAKANSVDVAFDLKNFAHSPILGIVLIDSDAANFTGGIGGVGSGAKDDIIGLGIYADDSLYSELTAGDSRSTALVRDFNDAFVRQVDRYLMSIPMFGANVSRPPASGALESTSAGLEVAKLSTDRCASGCRFGNSTVVIRTTPGGW